MADISIDDGKTTQTTKKLKLIDNRNGDNIENNWLAIGQIPRIKQSGNN